MITTVSLLNGLELLYPETPILSKIRKTLQVYPESEQFMVDAFSLGQIKSKLWLIEQLPDNLGMVFICAGWYGTLASFMFDRCPEKFDKIRSFDIDPTCAPIADTFNKAWVMDGWKFKASTIDINEMSYPATYTTTRSNGTTLELTEFPDTIINTSCEHIQNFADWYSKIPVGTKVVLQSNNFFDITEHVNCSASIEEFSNSVPMTTVIYEGELDLPKYKRFMKIGIK
jgi:hypothetical protein